MKLRILLLTAFAFCFASLQLSAQNATPGVSQKQVNQNKRINQGVKSGELTARETAQLKRQQRDIRRQKKAAKADGVVTPKERAELQRSQRRANRNIKRKKNNEISRN